MVRTREGLQAVFDDELQDLMKKLGLYSAFNAGRLTCAFCGDVITWDNLNAFFPDSGAVKVGCTRPHCVSALVEKVNRRTA